MVRPYTVGDAICTSRRTHRQPPRADGKPTPVGFNIVTTIRQYVEQLAAGTPGIGLDRHLCMFFWVDIETGVGHHLGLFFWVDIETGFDHHFCLFFWVDIKASYIGVDYFSG